MLLVFVKLVFGFSDEIDGYVIPTEGLDVKAVVTSVYLLGYTFELT